MSKCTCLFTQLTVNDKSQNLRRLQAQRNELNAKGKALSANFFLWMSSFGVQIHVLKISSVWHDTMCFALFPSVRLLREELQLLQEQGSYVGEVVRAMDKKKVLVKVWQPLFPAFLMSTISAEAAYSFVYLCFVFRCILKESLWWMWIRTLI